MNYTLLIVWCLLLTGALLASLLGRRASGWGASFAIATAIGMLVFFGINAALAACVENKRCPALGDSGIVYTLYPFLAIPVYWLAAGLAVKRRR